MSNNLCGLRSALSQADREDCPSRGPVVAIAAAGYRCILHGGYLGAAQSLSSNIPTSGFACEGSGDKVDIADFVCELIVADSLSPVFCVHLSFFFSRALALSKVCRPTVLIDGLVALPDVTTPPLNLSPITVGDWGAFNLPGPDIFSDQKVLPSRQTQAQPAAKAPDLSELLPCSSDSALFPSANICGRGLHTNHARRSNFRTSAWFW